MNKYKLQLFFSRQTRIFFFPLGAKYLKGFFVKVNNTAPLGRAIFFKQAWKDNDSKCCSGFSNGKASFLFRINVITSSTTKQYQVEAFVICFTISTGDLNLVVLSKYFDIKCNETSILSVFFILYTALRISQIIGNPVNFFSVSLKLNFLGKILTFDEIEKVFYYVLQAIRVNEKYFVF